MKNDAFDRAMNKIVGQHEAETQQEMLARQRAAMWAKIFGRVRIVMVILFIATLAVVAFNYQDQIANFFSSKKGAAPAAQAASSLQSAQENAAKRDAVINEISK